MNANAPGRSFPNWRVGSVFTSPWCHASVTKSCQVAFKNAQSLRDATNLEILSAQLNMFNLYINHYQPNINLSCLLFCHRLSAVGPMPLWALMSAKSFPAESKPWQQRKSWIWTPMLAVRSLSCEQKSVFFMFFWAQFLQVIDLVDGIFLQQTMDLIFPQNSPLSNQYLIYLDILRTGQKET